MDSHLRQRKSTTWGIPSDQRENKKMIEIRGNKVQRKRGRAERYDLPMHLLNKYLSGHSFWPWQWALSSEKPEKDPGLLGASV